MKRLLTVRCLDINREFIKAVARMDKTYETPTSKAFTAPAVGPEPFKAGGCDGSSAPLKAQMGMLLEDIERLTKEKEVMEGRLDRCSRASDEERFRVLLSRYDKVVARVNELEAMQ